MAVLRPFRGLRFSSSAGDLAELVAPPYDVISPDERQALFGHNQHNVVALTLPEQNPDDRSKFVKYARSAARLEQWRNEGVLALESKPAFYRYTQTFSVPGSDQQFERMCLMATIKVEPYEAGVVLPHEQTFPKHKEDRLRILEATRSHLECIYGLIEDSDQAFYKLAMSAPAARVGDVTSEDGVRHVLDVITDEATLSQLVSMVGPKRVWIADGHHRYETAVTFRSMQPASDGVIAEDFMLMALSSISDPGLVLLPTHRMLKHCPLSKDEMIAKFQTKFDVQPCLNADIPKLLAEATDATQVIFGVAFPGKEGVMLRGPRPTSSGDEGSNRLHGLDVTVLHDVIFSELLGLTGHEFFDYTREAAEALQAVEQGSPASFLMNPPTVDDMQVIAQSGNKMPQKSTFYYPKLWSGLVLWSLNDFEE